MEKLEELLEWGGTKRDITFLIISGIALILSIAKVPFPFNPAWIAIILCGIPIILEAIIGILIAIAGICYLNKEKDDPESRKIYRTIALIGAAIAVFGMIRMML